MPGRSTTRAETGSAGGRFRTRLVLPLAAVLVAGAAGVTGAVTAAPQAGAVTGCTAGPNADLTGCDFTGADLAGADLSGANLTAATFSSADLTGANLASAVVSDTDFSHADLTGSDLDDVQEADSCTAACTFTLAGSDGVLDVDIPGPNFTDAALTSASLDGSVLGGASYPGGTVCGTPTMCEPAVDVYEPANFQWETSGGLTGSPSSLPPGWSIVAGTLVAAPSFTSATSTVFTPGQSDTFTVVSVGGPIPTLTESGPLPAGVTFTANGDGTGTLAGAPAAAVAGTYPVELQSTNSSGTATQSLELEVGVPPVLTVVNPYEHSFAPGKPGSFTLASSGTPAPVISESGALPDGLTLTDGPDGSATLTGTPTPASSGVYPLAITASNGIGQPSSWPFDLYVGMSITTTSLPDGTVYSRSNRVVYSARLTSEGGNLPIKYSLAPGSGPLPPGLRLHDRLGSITGKATAAGTYSFTVEVADKKTKGTKSIPSTQDTATANLSITITDP